VRVLAACEFSGIVREAFVKKGHDAWSCDLLDTEILSLNHIIGDVTKILGSGWDLLIAHPPCTATCVSGNGTYSGSIERYHGIEFFAKFLLAPIDRVCVEHPVSVISSAIRPPDQYVQPWMFGHPESKKTGLWLKGLPKLTPTNVLPHQDRWDNQTPSGQNKLGPSADRWKERSRTYQGIADAMAEQWG
jgi:hypothetical protein